jgi:hypothetical protein
MAGSIFEEYATEQAGVEQRKDHAETEAHRITVVNIALGVFVGNILTAVLAAILYAVVK